MLDPLMWRGPCENLGFGRRLSNTGFRVAAFLARFFALNDHHQDALLHLSIVTIAVVIARTERKDAAWLINNALKHMSGTEPVVAPHDGSSRRRQRCR